MRRFLSDCWYQRPLIHNWIIYLCWTGATADHWRTEAHKVGNWHTPPQNSKRWCATSFLQGERWRKSMLGVWHLPLHSSTLKPLTIRWPANAHVSPPQHFFFHILRGSPKRAHMPQQLVASLAAATDHSASSYAACLSILPVPLNFQFCRTQFFEGSPANLVISVFKTVNPALETNNLSLSLSLSLWA